MFKLSSRRYTGAKTKLLQAIDESILKHFDYRKCKNLSFFDVFAGTGVVSEYFMQKPQFQHFIINDFLQSNFVIYQGFFGKGEFDLNKLEKIRQDFQGIESQKSNENLIDCHEFSTVNSHNDKKGQNYYAKHFGGTFFSKNDAFKIGAIREEIDRLLESQIITQKEFYMLLASLLYSSDRVANTVGHYDAYRKNIALEDRFNYELIEPLKTHKNIEIFKQDSNALVRDLVSFYEAHSYLKDSINDTKLPIDIAFLDPPYNSRQYSRFYHLLETLSTNDKPKLYGVALKPKPKNLSAYCKVEAKEALKDLVQNLAKISKFIVLTYNNTYSANARSNARIGAKDIKELLESVGQTSMCEYDFKAFSTGKSDLKNHKERIFICQVAKQ